MAVIECPEYGKGVSDKAKKYIHCVKFFVPAAIVIVVAIIGIVIYSVNVLNRENTYKEAVSLLEKGKYEEAGELFDTITGYSDVDTIQEQLTYESYAYSAVNSLKNYLNNPDPWQLYEITFYASMGTGGNSAGLGIIGISAETGDEKYPVCIMHYGTQNGSGGNTTGYALCTYDTKKGEYELLGACDPDDDDDMYDLLICKLINLYREGDDTVGNIDLARLKAVLENDAILQ